MGGLVAFVVAAVTKAIASFSIANFLISTIIQFALGAIIDALTPKPSKPTFSAELSSRTQSLRQPITPHRIIFGEVRVSGAVTFLQTTNNDGLFHMVLTIAGHSIDSIQQYYFEDELLTLGASGKPTSGTWNNRARLVAGLGTTATDAAFNTALIANVPGQWTTDHRQSGRAKVYVEGVTEEFGQGVPNASFIVRGNNEIFDPRDSSTGYSKNAALCIRKYLTADFGLGEPTARIDDTSFIAAANICEESITLDGGGTENRYDLNGTIETTKEPRIALGEMLSACAGILTYQGGKWALYVGAYRTPTITFDEDTLDGPIRVQTRIGRKDIFNRVKGVFVNPDDFYNPTDFPIVTNAGYLGEDGAEVIDKDISLTFTTSSATAQRLAKIILEKVRQQITLEMPLNLNGLRVQIGDVVNITNAAMGFLVKPFEVTAFKFASRATASDEGPRLGVDLVLRETASTIYDWANGEETVLDPSPNSNLPSPFTVEVPGDLLVTSGNEGLVVTAEGTVVSNLHVTWTNPVSSFTQFIETQFKLTSSSVWTNGPNVIDNEEVLLGPVESGTQYDVRIRQVTHIGKKSAYVTNPPHTVIGKTAPPDDVTTFVFTEQPDGTRLYAWTQDIIPADVRVGGGYEIRYFVGSTSNWDGMTNLNPLGLVRVSPFESNQLAAGTYTFAIKAVDSSGNESTNAVFITAVSLDNPRIGEALIVRNESSLSFPGTKFDCTLSGGILSPDADGEDWSDLAATWSALPDSWNELILNKTPIMYTTPELDLGADAKMTPLVTVTGVGTATITMQTGTAADGAVTGDVTITSSSVANPSNILCAAVHGVTTGDLVEINGHSGSTPDINGLHTVTVIDTLNYTIPVNVTTGGTGGTSKFFKALDTEQIRYIKLRVSMAATDPLIQEITTIIDSPSKKEFFDDINTATETGAWFNSIAAGHFQVGSEGSIGVITQASIKAIQNVGAGFTWELLNKTSTVNGEVAAEYKIYNASNVLTDATVDIELRGGKK